LHFESTLQLQLHFRNPFSFFNSKMTRRLHSDFPRTAVVPKSKRYSIAIVAFTSNSLESGCLWAWKWLCFNNENTDWLWDKVTQTWVRYRNTCIVGSFNVARFFHNTFVFIIQLFLNTKYSTYIRIYQCNNFIPPTTCFEE